MTEWKKAKDVLTPAQLRGLKTLKKAVLSGNTIKELTPDGLVRMRVRGRPKIAKPKEQVTIRLSADVLEHFKGMGPGWQTRIDETLRGFIA